MVALTKSVERSRTEPMDPDPAIAVATTDGVTWTWDDLVNTFAPALGAYARSRGIREADDVVQDVLLTAVRKLSDFDGDSDNLRSWLFTLAYRRIADQHRSFYRSPTLLLADHEPTPSGDEDVNTGLLESEALDDALSALDVLDDRQRDVLHLRIIEELSPGEVAEQLGLRSGHVRVIQSRALQRVRRHLRNRTKTLDRTAAAPALMPVMSLLTRLRDLRVALPSDDVITPWIDQVRAAWTSSGPGGVVSDASAASAATSASASAGTSTTAASTATTAGQSAVLGGMATKIGATGLGIAMVVGSVIAGESGGLATAAVPVVASQGMPDVGASGDPLASGRSTPDAVEAVDVMAGSGLPFGRDAMLGTRLSAIDDVVGAAAPGNDAPPPTAVGPHGLGDGTSGVDEGDETTPIRVGSLLDDLPDTFDHSVFGVARSVTTAASGVGDTVEGAASGVGDIVEGVVSGGEDAARGAASGVGGTVEGAVSGVGGAVEDVAASEVEDAGENAASGVGDVVDHAASNVGDIVDDAASEVGDTVDGAADGVGGTVDDAVSDVGDTVDDAVSGAGDTVGDAVSGISDAVDDSASGIVNALTDPLDQSP